MNRSGKILLSLILSFSLFCLPAFADESTLPSNSLSTMSLDSQGFIYVAMLNTGSDEWGQFIDKMNTVITNDSGYVIFIDDYGVKGYYGNFSITQSGTLTYISGSYISMNFADDEPGTGTSGNVTLNNAPIVAMNTTSNTGIFGTYENKNIIDWDTAVRLYGRSVPSEYQEIIDAIDNQTQTIIDGTDASSSVADDADSINSDLKDKIDEFDELEQSYINDFNDNLADIDVSGFNWDSSFLTSAAWVTTQFNELVMETPFENLITFSLIIGICLFLIGRYRGV